VSKPAMNIDGLSEATLDFLIDKGWVKSFTDLYELETKPGVVYEWKLTSGYGEKSVDKILDAIESSRDVKLENFICALSIDGVGRSASKTIANAFNGDFDAFYKAFKNHYNWADLSDVGDKTSANITKYLAENEAEIVDLASEMRFVVPEKIEIKENPFVGKNICVTGKLNTFTRDSINTKIVELGAKVASGVSAKTDYLITNTPDSGSSKNMNAKKFGTKIITEAQFLEMISK
jgi:DNA ligase (NAD+)